MAVAVRLKSICYDSVVSEYILNCHPLSNQVHQLTTHLVFIIY